MKVLLIGGTGNISTYVTQQLVEQGEEVTLLTRGLHDENAPAGVRFLHGNIEDEAGTAKLLQDLSFDVVANFINFVPEQVERDIRLFTGKTKQYILISSCAVYTKPLSNYQVTEGSPTGNPVWQYAQDKLACEQVMKKAFREDGFPMTIVRPSHTYAHALPVAMQGKKGSWAVLKRMMEGKPVILHGDGRTIWTVTHSSDVARGIVGLMGNIHALGETVHITNDESLTWDQIYTVMAGCVGKKPELRHLSTEIIVRHCPQYEGQLYGDLCNSAVFDNTKLKRLVPGYHARLRFDQGCRLAVQYLMDHPELQQDDPEFDAETEMLLDIYEKM